MTLSYRAGQYSHLDTLNSKICLLVMILSIFFQKKTQKFFLVPFFTTMEVVAPLENHPILSGRSIRSFRYLELQNPSTGYDFIHIFPKKNSKVIFSSLFHHHGGSGATWKWSYLIGQVNTVISIPWTPKSVYWLWFYPYFPRKNPQKFFSSIFHHHGGGGATTKWSYLIGHVDTVI